MAAFFSIFLFFDENIRNGMGSIGIEKKMIILAK